MEILFSVTSLSNGTNSIDKLSGFELPDGPLLLLDRLNLKHNIISNINAQYARQNQGSNDTSTSSRRCTCNLGVCKCCTGLLLDLFNQKACMKVTYHPGDFAFDVAMSFNDRVLYENSVSGTWMILCIKFGSANKRYTHENLTRTWSYHISLASLTSLSFLILFTFGENFCSPI